MWRLSFDVQTVRHAATRTSQSLIWRACRSIGKFRPVGRSSPAVCSARSARQWESPKWSRHSFYTTLTAGLLFALSACNTTGLTYFTVQGDEAKRLIEQGRQHIRCGDDTTRVVVIVEADLSGEVLQVGAKCSSD